MIAKFHKFTQFNLKINNKTNNFKTIFKAYLDERQ